MRVFTVGFTRKTAAEFFPLVRDSGARRIVDVRLNNTSQLSRFAVGDDLEYFLRSLRGLGRIGYVHLPELAPSPEILREWRASRRRDGDWARYEGGFLDLMRRRRVEETVPREAIADGCLLCSEHEPDRCHRRLVVEYLKGRGWPVERVVHLPFDGLGGRGPSR